MTLPSKGGASAQDSAEQIAEVAAALFARHGVDGVSMSQLAREAGLSKAAIYHHFTNKSTLYFYVLQRKAQELAGYLEGQLNSAMPADEVLKAFAGYQMSHINRHADATQLMLRELLDGSSAQVKSLMDNIYGANFQRLLELIRAGQTAGVFRDEMKPDVVAVTVTASLLFNFLGRNAWAHTPGVQFHGDPDGFASDMVDLVLKGLRAPTRDSG